MHLNVRSLIKHITDVHDIIEIYSPDILLLCETFLHKNNVNQCDLPNYDFYHSNRKSGKGGGVAIFARKSLKTKRSSCTLTTTENVENLFVECSF